MSYGIILTASAIGKQSQTYTLTIRDKNQGVDAATACGTASNPFIAQIQASSDNPFDPIVATTFNVSLDVTDYTGILPDFTSQDDRRYYVSFEAGSTLLFIGYTINNSVSYSFTTGRKVLSFQCVDGLGLLKDVPYSPTVEDINLRESLILIITNCLSQIGFVVNRPTYPYKVFSCVSVFATGMGNRSYDTDNEPFNQSYMYPRSFLNSDNEYISCYEILENICKGFGVQLFQSGGDFYLMSVTERFDDEIYFTEYSDDAGILSSGLLKLHRTIKPYNETNPFYFINNSQAKILRKGYPNIELNCPFSYSVQGINNGSLTALTSGFPDYWNSASVGGSVVINVINGYNFFTINPGPTLEALVSPTSVSKIAEGEIMNLSFFLGTFSTISATPIVRIRAIIDDGVNQYYLASTGNWDGGPSGLYPVVGTDTTSTYETITITTQKAPVSGTLFLEFTCQNGQTRGAATIGNFFLTFSYDNSQRVLFSEVDPEFTYKLSETIRVGGQQTPTQQWALVDTSNQLLTGWYRQGYTESYNNLLRLVTQEYVNVLTPAQINLDCDVKKLLGPKDSEVSDTYVQIANAFKAQDTDTYLNVAGFAYNFGNLSLNYTRDQLQGTLLQVDNTEVTTTITDTIIERYGRRSSG